MTTHGIRGAITIESDTKDHHPFRDEGVARCNLVRQPGFENGGYRLGIFYCH